MNKEDNKVVIKYSYKSFKRFKHNIFAMVKNSMEETKNGQKKSFEVTYAKRKGILGDYYYLPFKTDMYEDLIFDPNENADLGEKYVNKMIECFDDKTMDFDKQKALKIKNFFENQKNDARAMYKGNILIFE